MIYWLVGIPLLVIGPLCLDIFTVPKMWALSFLFLVYRKEVVEAPISYYFSFQMPHFFLLGLIPAVLFSNDIGISLFGCELMGFQGLIQILLYYLVFRMSVRSDPLMAILVLIIPVIVYGILQRLGYDYHHPTWGIPIGRALSTQGNPVFFSMLIAMLIPLVMQMIDNLATWINSLLFVLMIAGLWSAGSRIGWLGLGIGILFYFV